MDTFFDGFRNNYLSLGSIWCRLGRQMVKENLITLSAENCNRN